MTISINFFHGQKISFNLKCSLNCFLYNKKKKYINIKALNAVSTTENGIHLRLFSFPENIHCLNYLILFLWIAFYHVKTAFLKLSLSSSE